MESASNIRPAAIGMIILLVLAAASPLGFAQQGVEEETVLLTITGDLIGKLESLDEDAMPKSVIDSYYALLPVDLRNQLRTLQTNMARRSEDYQIAFRAGDTAEINEIVDELSFNWATIRTVHAQEFTEEAIADLVSAYAQIYPVIAL